MRWLIALLLLVYSIGGYTQQPGAGRIISGEDGIPVPLVHIQNLSQEKFTVSNEQGFFKLPMEKGDSIWLSCIGYKSVGYIIEKRWAQMDTINFTMQEDTIMLHALTILELPSERIFKQQILDYQPEDTALEIFGLPKDLSLTGSTFPEDGDFVPKLQSRSPVGAIYSRFSKKEKEKRKMARILASEKDHDQIQSKFNREIVGQITNLKGDDLTHFIDFCDFSEEFLKNSTQFQIAEAIVHMYKEFKKSKKS